MIERLASAAGQVQQRPVPVPKAMETGKEGKKELPLKQEVKGLTQEEQDQLSNPRVKKKLEEIVKGLNDFMLPAHTSLKFELHEKLNEYFVTVIDDVTHEVVREIPSKKLLDTYAAMAEHLGLLVDERV